MRRKGLNGQVGLGCDRFLEYTSHVVILVAFYCPGQYACSLFATAARLRRSLQGIMFSMSPLVSFPVCISTASFLFRMIPRPTFPVKISTEKGRSHASASLHRWAVSFHSYIRFMSSFIFSLLKHDAVGVYHLYFPGRSFY